MSLQDHFRYTMYMHIYMIIIMHLSMFPPGVCVCVWGGGGGAGELAEIPLGLDSQNSPCP